MGEYSMNWGLMTLRRARYRAVLTISGSVLRILLLEIRRGVAVRYGRIDVGVTLKALFPTQTLKP